MSWETKDDFWFNVTFICRHQQLSEGVIHRVYLVGDFNGWRLSEEYSMRQCEEGYSVQVLLSEGFYHYKYLVDGEYVRDEANPHVAGAFGNSIMFVHMDPAVYHIKTPRDQIHPQRVHHSGCGSELHTLCPEVPPDISSHGILQRLVFVYTPPSYTSHTNHTYPVVYAHDGQNLFSTPEGEGGLCWGGWYLDAKLDYWWTEKTLPEFILVAVPSAELASSGNRQREYAVTEYSSARSQPYVCYITDVVKTAVDAQFRTKADSQHTFTLGASLGGLFAFVLTMSHPDVFSSCVCMSPAFWFVDRSNKSAYSLVQMKDDLNATPCVRVYIDSGDGEGDNMEVVRYMAEVMEEKKWRQGQDYKYQLEQCSHREPCGVTHSEKVWRERVLAGLKFILSSSS